MLRDTRQYLVYEDAVRRDAENAPLRGPMIDHYRDEREKRAAEYARRAEEIEELVGGFGHDGSARSLRLERALRRATIF